MASSLSGLFSSSSSFKLEKSPPKSPLATQSASFPTRSKILDRLCIQSVAREIPSSLSKAKTESPSDINKKGLEKDPTALWQRYVEWLYQHKELGLYLDVSRVGFTDEFVAEMEPKFQSAFRAMEELEKGAIANPDEGRMVGHYWLRNWNLAPSKYLKLQIENTIAVLCAFADDVVSELSPVSARLLRAKNDDHIQAAYGIPVEQRSAHILLGYKPLYTSFLKKRKKVPKKKNITEEAGPSRKRKRAVNKGKAIVPISIPSDSGSSSFKTESESDLFRGVEHLLGRIREPREVEFLEEESGEVMDDLPSLFPAKKKTKTRKNGSSPVAPNATTKRTTDADNTAVAAELQKKQKMLMLGSGADIGGSKGSKSPLRIDVPDKEIGKGVAEVTSSPFQFIPTLKSGKPVLVSESVREHPTLALSVLKGVCLPEDMKKVPSDLDSNITEMFSHMTLACQSAVAMHDKLLSVTGSVVSMKSRLKDETKLRAKAEKQVKDMSKDLEAARSQLSELELAKKQLSEMEDLKRQLSEIKSSREQELRDAHKAGFDEAKLKVFEYYKGQVAKIKDNSFRRGAKIYYFRGVATGYGLGLEAGGVSAESALQAVPDVEAPEIEIPSEEEEEDAEAEEDDIGENAEATGNAGAGNNVETGKDEQPKEG